MFAYFHFKISQYEQILISSKYISVKQKYDTIYLQGVPTVCERSVMIENIKKNLFKKVVDNVNLYIKNYFRISITSEPCI